VRPLRAAGMDVCLQQECLVDGRCEVRGQHTGLRLRKRQKAWIGDPIEADVFGQPASISVGFLEKDLKLQLGPSMFPG